MRCIIVAAQNTMGPGLWEVTELLHCSNRMSDEKHQKANDCCTKNFNTSLYMPQFPQLPHTKKFHWKHKLWPPDITSVGQRDMISHMLGLNLINDPL